MALVQVDGHHVVSKFDVNGVSRVVVGKVKCGLFPSSRRRFFCAFFKAGQ